MRNFNFPYFSRDIAEFWRRWHISLTTWFRDYVYIPLGGSRVSKTKIARNTFIIFLLSGFWHGANWTFICWGAFHALLFLPLILAGKNRKYTNVVAKGRIFPCIKELLQMGTTFGFVVFGWVFFRAESFAKAIEYIRGIFSESLLTIPYLNNGKKQLFICLCILLLFEWLHRNKQHGLEIGSMNKYLRHIIYIVLIISMILFMGKNETFIYFQF
jgi:D-alanyl-lipoteichoic acid acyltransferase DltB (MBOAT superfamily)